MYCKNQVTACQNLGMVFESVWPITVKWVGRGGDLKQALSDGHEEQRRRQRQPGVCRHVRSQRRQLRFVDGIVGDMQKSLPSWGVEPSTFWSTVERVGTEPLPH